MLRSLCRRCLEIRATLVDQSAAEVEDQVAALNIFIVIVTKYFQQRDLCEDIL